MDNMSKRIKLAMSIRNMKQSDLIDKTGISKGAISSYISGRYLPKQDNTYLIAKALNVSVEWLMGKDVPMEPKSPAAPGQENELLKEHIKNYSQLIPEFRSLIDDLIKAAQEEPRDEKKILELTIEIATILRS